jgi:Transglutaminase-like superfamily
MLYILPHYEFSYKVYKNEIFPIKVEPDGKEGRIFFEMQNIPGLDDEPYMEARRDYIQRVTFQPAVVRTRFGTRTYMTSWDELIKELANTPELGHQVTKDLSGTEGFIKLVKLNASAVEKMKLVYSYVRKNMNWNGQNSKYSIDGVKSAWNKKKGTSGDLNLILVNLLKAAGLEAYPMLVSERYNGRVSTQYPFVDQFNTVCAAVFIDKQWYYLDATDNFTPPHIIPYNILNTTALILNKKVGGLVNIIDESRQYRESVSITATITADETIKGETLLHSADYARVRRLERYHRDNAKYIDENFKQSGSVTVDSFKISNEDNDSLVLQNQFSFIKPINGTGDYKFIPLNLFSGFEQNPFISDKRFSDINFGYRRNISLNSVLALPADYVVDAMPKSVQLVNPDRSIIFKRDLLRDESTNKIVCHIGMEFKKSHYTAAEYDDIKEFYKKMFEMLNEQIVLKKKS